MANAPGYEQACQKASHRLCDLFAVSKWAEQRDLLVNLEIHMCESGEVNIAQKCYYFTFFSFLNIFVFVQLEKFNDSNHYRKPFWPVTLYWLIYRNLLILCRDPTVQLLKLVQKMVRFKK